jgi:hypothetical protein
MYPIKLPLQRAVKRNSVLHKQLLNALDTHRIGVCREGTLHVPAKPMTASLGDRAAGTRARALPVLPVHRMCGGTFAAPGGGGLFFSQTTASKEYSRRLRPAEPADTSG